MNNPITSQPPLKHCTKCHEKRPATAEYFHANKDGKDGLQSVCKICRRRASPETLEAETLRTQGLKRCAKCDAIKPATVEFFQSKHGARDGLVGQCRICWAQYYRRIRASKPEHAYDPSQTKQCTKCAEIKPATTEYFRRDKGCRDRLQSQCKECAAQIGRNHYNQNPEHYRQKGRRYHLKNPEIGHMTRNRRRARIHGLPDTLTLAQWRMCLAYFDHRCAACERKSISLSADHWIAVTDLRPDNPGTVVTNTVCLCGSCNSSKSNRDAAKWLEWKFGAQRATQVLNQVHAYFEWVRLQTVGKSQ